jgi:hypothetical protein
MQLPDVFQCLAQDCWSAYLFGTVSLYDHVAAAVSGARFATAELISFKLGFLAPPGNIPRCIFHFRDMTYFMRNTAQTCF